MDRDRAPAIGAVKIAAIMLLTYGPLGLLFVGLAGHARLPWVWATLMAFAAGHLLMMVWALRSDPELVAERQSRRPGVPAWDRAFAWVGGAIYLANMAVTTLDVTRAHWTDTVPTGLRVAGLVAIVGGMAFFSWAMRVNTFFARVVRIQRDRGHRVVDTGPYRLVRHPGYLAGLVWWTGFHAALGSWLGLALSLVAHAALVYRTAREDALLRRELDGYEAYAARVRWRLIPGLW